MKSIILDRPARIEYQGGQKKIRGGTEVFIDGRRKNYYSAFPVVVSEDVAIKYLGYKPPADETPTEDIEDNGS